MEAEGGSTRAGRVVPPIQSRGSWYGESWGSVALVEDLHTTVANPRLQLETKGRKKPLTIVSSTTDIPPSPTNCTVPAPNQQQQVNVAFWPRSLSRIHASSGSAVAHTFRGFSPFQKPSDQSCVYCEDPCQAVPSPFLLLAADCHPRTT